MKKENILLIIGIVLTALFVIFLPTIDDILSGRKINIHGDDKKQEEKQPTEYICTSVQESNLSNETKKTIFKLSNDGKVTTIDTTVTTIYHSKSEYLTNKKAAQNLKEEGITYNISSDDNHLVLEIQSIQDINKNSNTSYPIQYKELNKYLAQNNYVCSTK